MIAWLAAVLVAAVVCFGLYLAYRAELRRLQAIEGEVIGRWRRIRHGQPFPRGCTDCGTTAYAHWQMAAHDSNGSPCLTRRMARDLAADNAPGRGWKVDPIDTTDAEEMAASGELE